MQMGFDFGDRATIRAIGDRLGRHFGAPDIRPSRGPTGQLVKSLISGRTRDAVSLGAYHRLVAAYPSWAAARDAAPAALEAVIADVSFADAKARWLAGTLAVLATERSAFDLDFLGLWPVGRALAWLERLPGVGRKVAASTLNFSTLARPAFVVDSHVLRVLGRVGLIGARADTVAAYDRVMAAAEMDAAGLATLHCLIKRLGQTYCRPHRPDCARCPLRSRCRAAAGPFSPAGSA